MNSNQELKIWKTNTLEIDNLQSVRVNPNSIIKTIQDLRTQNTTKMNKQSSRSYAFFKVSAG